jgi:hypothetical protein
MLGREGVGREGGGEQVGWMIGEMGEGVGGMYGFLVDGRDC